MEDRVKKIARSGLGRGLAALISQPPMPVAVPANKLSAVTPGQVSNDVLATGTEFPASQSQDLTHGGAALKLYSGPDLLKTTITNDAIANYVSINDVINNPLQPRQEFKESEIVELAASIKKLGVLQPIVVRPSKLELGKYEIIAGERRWRASKLAALLKVPVIIKEIDDREALEIAIVENVQRENLNALEQARAYQRLADEFSLSQEEIAERVGKDRATVSNTMRILKLSAEIHPYINEGKLSLGHAKALLSIKDPKAQISLAKKTILEQLSVRALEQLVGRVIVLDGGKAKRSSPKNEADQNSAEMDETTEKLRRALATKVLIKKSRGQKGAIVIDYFSTEELERLVERICQI